MTADANIAAKVQRIEGGDEQTLAAGGRITTYVLSTTANSTMPGHGLLVINQISTNPTTHTVGAPWVGSELTIHCLDVSTVSTGHLIGTGSTAVVFGSSGLRFIRFTDRDKSITLMGASTSRYVVKSMSASGVALST